MFQISIQDISSKTGLQHNDIALTLMLLGFMGKNNNKFMLAVDWDKVEDHMKKAVMSLAKKSRYAIYKRQKNFTNKWEQHSTDVAFFLVLLNQPRVRFPPILKKITLEFFVVTGFY